MTRLRYALLRFSAWRCRWFPYRTVEFVDVGEYGPQRWQWPDVLGKDMR